MSKLLIWFAWIAVVRGVSTRYFCDLSRPPFKAKSLDKNLTNVTAQESVERNHTAILQHALATCQEIWIPSDLSLLTGPFNLSSNQVLTIDGVLLATDNPASYPIVAPLLGYGWSNDENCFPPDAAPHKIVIGKLRYAPFIGIFHASNVTIRGSGRIDGRGKPWWKNCTRCHYIRQQVGNESLYCLTAGRPKLIEAQFVNGFSIYGGGDKQDISSTPLTLANSPFWTLTAHYSQTILISNLEILAPVTKIGNTDGANLDSCRNAEIQHLSINNGDDGIALKSGLNGFGLNLGIPTENVWINNITTKGRGGFAIGSEMSGGIRNITFSNSRLLGSRSILFKPSVGRGGYIDNIHFQNIQSSKASFVMNHDGIPIMPNNHYVPLVSNIRFENVTHVDLQRGFASCSSANQSKCFNLTSDSSTESPWSELLPSTRFYTCKTAANTMMEEVIQLPWPVCLPLDSPVNLWPDYPNWGPTRGNYSSLEACWEACTFNDVEQTQE